MRMRNFWIWIVVISGAAAVPYVHIERSSDSGSLQGTTLWLKRIEESSDVHPEIAMVQAKNRVHKKFAKRYHRWEKLV